MWNRLQRPWQLGLLALGTAAVAAAQDATPQVPAFDVVSIRQFVDGGPRRVEWTPGRFVALGAPLPGLVNMAYGGGAPVRLEGGDALRGMAWDITATFDPAFTPTLEQRAAMLRAVLEDRFRLVLRRESRETDVYALLLVRPDGQPGPSLQPSELPCTSPPRASFSVGRLPPDGQRPAC
ncbi:MAG TPA: TIGR03435 family protein, partial [Vicinamibacterales bacterium]|nr:TIGR03435 family protein [Vicinamibacterales bacterium]